MADPHGEKSSAMINSPCKGCERRTVKPNCHATCQDYKDFVIKRQEYLAAKRKDNVICEYIDQLKRKR